MVSAVTGAGLERSVYCATQVAESGARVIATARNVQKAPGLHALVQAHGRETLQVVACDVTDAASLKVYECFHRPDAAASRARAKCAASLMMAGADQKGYSAVAYGSRKGLDASCEAVGRTC